MKPAGGSLDKLQIGGAFRYRTHFHLLNFAFSYVSICTAVDAFQLTHGRIWNCKLLALGSTQPPTEMSTRNVSRGLKVAGC
jgi:hypothetical protein